MALFSAKGRSSSGLKERCDKMFVRKSTLQAETRRRKTPLLSPFQFSVTSRLIPPRWAGGKKASTGIRGLITSVLASNHMIQRSRMASGLDISCNRTARRAASFVQEPFVVEDEDRVVVDLAVAEMGVESWEMDWVVFAVGDCAFADFGTARRGWSVGCEYICSEMYDLRRLCGEREMEGCEEGERCIGYRGLVADVVCVASPLGPGYFANDEENARKQSVGRDLEKGISLLPVHVCRWLQWGSFWHRR
jgi:hypothetical protein